jgi:hypothetical protein
VCVQKERARAAFEHRSTQYLYANATARAVEGDLGGFLRVARMRGHGRNGNRSGFGKSMISSRGVESAGGCLRESTHVPIYELIERPERKPE